MREELGELFVKSSQGVNLLQSLANICGVGWTVWTSLPPVGTVVRPVNSRQLGTDLRPFLTQGLTLSTDISNTVINTP